MIYLNASSHGLPDSTVNRRIIDHLELEARIGVPMAVEQAEAEFTAVRTKAARLLNADINHVGFSGSTLSAWRIYVKGLGLGGKRVLVAPHEWGENIRLLKTLGAQVEMLPPLDFTDPDLSAWQDAFQGDVAAIFIPMVSSIAGLRYPVEAIGRLPRGDARLIIDAAQAVGQVPVDITALGCDAFFSTTRKWARGPRQTALFWLADRAQIAQIEPMDAHVGLRLGLGVAFDIILLHGVKAIQNDLRERTTRARQRAADLELSVLSPPEAATGAVTLSIPAGSAKRLSAALKETGIDAKWPVAAADEPLSGIDETKIKPLRLSPHLSNTLQDVDATFDCIADAL